jgi:hypothetical protein
VYADSACDATITYEQRVMKHSFSTYFKRIDQVPNISPKGWINAGLLKNLKALDIDMKEDTFKSILPELKADINTGNPVDRLVILMLDSGNFKPITSFYTGSGRQCKHSFDWWRDLSIPRHVHK